MSSSRRRQSRGRSGPEVDVVQSQVQPPVAAAVIAPVPNEGLNDTAPVASGPKKLGAQAAASRATGAAVRDVKPVAAKDAAKPVAASHGADSKPPDALQSRSSSGTRSRSRASSEAALAAPSALPGPSGSSAAAATPSVDNASRISASAKASKHGTRGAVAQAPAPAPVAPLGTAPDADEDMFDEGGASDMDEFELTASEPDEEATLIEQEKEEVPEDVADEIAALEKEADMDIEQLRAMYAAAPGDDGSGVDDDADEEEEVSMEEEEDAPAAPAVPSAPTSGSRSRSGSRHNSDAAPASDIPVVVKAATPSSRSRTASTAAPSPPARAATVAAPAPQSAMQTSPMAGAAPRSRATSVASTSRLAAAALPQGISVATTPVPTAPIDMKPGGATVPSVLQPVFPSVAPPSLLPMRAMSAATDDASVTTSVTTGTGKAVGVKRKGGMPQSREALLARRAELLAELIPVMADDTTDGKWMMPADIRQRKPPRVGIEADMYAAAEILEAGDTIQAAGIDTSYSITSLGEPPAVGGYVLAANPSGTASLDLTLNAASVEARMDVLRPRVQWDYLLDEMTWLASDVYHERERKVRQAKRLSQAVLKHFERKVKKMVEDAQLEQQRARRRAARIAQNVGKFWTQVDKLVIFKHRSRLDAIRRMALDKHLNFLVGQTERYAALLAAQVSTDAPASAATTVSAVVPASAPAPQLPGPATAPTIEAEEDDDAMEGDEEEDADEDAAQASGDAALGEMLDGGSDEDEGDFSMDSDASAALDDEETIEAEEAAAKSHRKRARMAETASADAHEHRGDDIEEDAAGGEEDDEEDELAALRAEADLSIDDLMRRHGLVPDSETAGAQEVQVSETTGAAPGARRRRRATAGQSSAPASTAVVPRPATPPPPQSTIDIPYLFRRGELLRPYQRDGLDWLVSMHDRRLNGILADEMGLGKTIQTISLLAHLAAARCMWGPHLIVVPTSTILNWEMEFRRWCPALKVRTARAVLFKRLPHHRPMRRVQVITYFGSVKERKIKRLGWTKSNAFHVVITSYQMVLADAAIFRRKHWYYLILDEAHYIKNYQSQRWQTLLTFASRRRLLLTGTPLQNSLMELWSLMHFLMPHLFRSQAEFKQWFSNPLTQHVEGGPSVDPVLVRRLHAVLRPFVLRRLKSEVAKQMPKKYEHVIMCRYVHQVSSSASQLYTFRACRLSQRQRFLYEDFMSRSSTRAALSGASFMTMMNVLMQLRKVCNHPDLFEPRPIVSPMELPLVLYAAPRIAVDARTLAPSRLTDAVTLTGDTTVAPPRSWARSLNDAHLLQLALYAPLAVLSLPDAASHGAGLQASILSPFLCASSSARDAIAASAACALSSTGRACSFFSRKQITVQPVPATNTPSALTRLLTGTTVSDTDTLRAQQLVGAVSAALLSVSDNSDDNASSPAFYNGVSFIHGIVNPLLNAGSTPAAAPASATSVSAAAVDAYIRAVEARDGFSAEVERSIAARLASAEGQARTRFNGMPQLLALQAMQAEGSVDTEFIEGEPSMGALLLAPLHKFSKNIILLHAARRARVRCVLEQQLRASIALNDVRAAQPHRAVHAAGLLRLLSVLPVCEWMTAPTPDAQIGAILDHAAQVDTMEGQPSPPLFIRGAIRGGMYTLNALARPEHVVLLSSLSAAPSCATASLAASSHVLVQVMNASRFAVPELASLDDDKQARRGMVGGAPPSPGAWWTYSDTLRGMVRSLQETYVSLQPELQRFVFVIPKAIARSPRMLASLPPREHAPAYRHSEHAVVHAARMVDARLHDVCVRQSLSFPDRRLVQFDCGKLQALDNLLRDRKAGGHRCLIFTQMSRMLDILETFLNLHHHTYLRLDGSTKVEERQRLMERFNRDERMFVFILSTRSGGLGINLVGADTVIFYDSDWNPAMDAQAQDRAHRIGQTRDVHIYRMVSESTIEENILLKARQKRHLSHLSLEEGNFTVERLTSTDGADADDLPRTWMPDDDVGKLVDAATSTLGGDSAADEATSGAALSRDVMSALEAAEDDADRDAGAKAAAEVRAEMAEFDEGAAPKADSSAAGEDAEDDDADAVKPNRDAVKDKRKKARRGNSGASAGGDEDDEADEEEATQADDKPGSEEDTAGAAKGKKGVHFADETADAKADVDAADGTKKRKRSTRAAARKSNLDIDLDELQRQTTEEQERVVGDEMDVAQGGPSASAVSAAGRSSAQTLFDSALASSRGTTTPTAPTRDRVAIALAKFGEIQSKLREAERYALVYRELHDPHPWVEPSLLKALEDQFESEEKEWELEQLEAMKADDESKAEADAELLQLSRAIGGVADPVAAGKQLYETTLRTLRRGIRMRAVNGSAWQQKMDEVKRLPYYFNVDTKEAVWERPIVLRKADARKGAARSRWQQICALPGTALRIMRFLAPMERAHAASHVCRHWRAACAHPLLYKYVRLRGAHELLTASRHPADAGTAATAATVTGAAHHVYSDLGDAVDASVHGDTIVVGFGSHYVDHPLRITQRVRIMSQGVLGATFAGFESPDDEWICGPSGEWYPNLGCVPPTIATRMNLVSSLRSDADAPPQGAPLSSSCTVADSAVVRVNGSVTWETHHARFRYARARSRQHLRPPLCCMLRRSSIPPRSTAFNLIPSWRVVVSCAV